MTAKYDYVKAVRDAYRSNPVLDQAARKVLRKLVKAAVLSARGDPDNWRDDDSPTQREMDEAARDEAHKDADRIARELIPGSQKRGRK